MNRFRSIGDTIGDTPFPTTPMRKYSLNNPHINPPPNPKPNLVASSVKATTHFESKQDTSRVR